MSVTNINGATDEDKDKKEEDRAWWHLMNSNHPYEILLPDIVSHATMMDI